jgi:hypothetical protein
MLSESATCTVKEPNEDNSMPFNRSDRLESMVPESRSENSNIHAGAPLALRGRTEDPTIEDRQPGLLLRRAYSTARAYAATEAGLSTDPRGQLAGSAIRVIWESWRIKQSEFQYRQRGVVNLGEIG